MSSGATNNLGLIYPNGDDPVPNWPQINTFNSDKLDDLFSLPSFQNYVPSLEHSDGSPNIGLTGQILGRFYRIFDMYFFYIWVLLQGSGVNMGTGTLRLTLPVDVDSEYKSGNTGSAVGGGYFHDSSAGFSRSPLTAKLSGSGGNVIFLTVSKDMNGRTSWILQGDNPAAMTADDQIEVYGKFKAAV